MKGAAVTTLLLLGVAIIAVAEQKAITSNGEEVILHDNGKWNYVDNKKQSTQKIKSNKSKFTKSKDATFLVKSKINDSGFYINPQKWLFQKGVAPKEYMFQLRGKSLGAMAIAEEISISTEALATIGVENARKVASNIQVLTQEYRNVNGLKVIYTEMTGDIKGLKFIYFAYYYADASGATQFVVYTTPNLVPKYKTEIDEFLNGLVKQ